MIFLFDVDGTLTPARQGIELKFKDFFYNWIIQRQRYGDKVYFVTGSDKDKTIEQIGEKIWLQVDGSYQNCANQLYCKGQLIKESNWRLPDDLMWDIIDTLSTVFSTTADTAIICDPNPPAVGALTEGTKLIFKPNRY